MYFVGLIQNTCELGLTYSLAKLINCFTYFKLMANIKSIWCTVEKLKIINNSLKSDK